jgi:DNA-binding transcriptional MerR regulator/effector-binding domain-containing protein
MRPSLAIGDFSRATHLSVKMLRHYHRIGLLEPADVDPDTGHRRYTTEQIPTAQVIRRFRALEMPLEEIQSVIAAPDLDTRNELIAAHLDRLEENLAKTQEAAASLRDLLRPRSGPDAAKVEHRSAAATPAVAVSEVIDVEDALSWYLGALGELYATLAAQRLPSTGPAGGIYSGDLFAHERGLATIFVPYQGTVRPMGRVTSLVVPAVELAMTLHTGSHTDIDRAYGTLATYVTRHALAVDGPIREYYLVGQHETSDESQWRTEIGWPIFQTGEARTRPAF